MDNEKILEVKDLHVSFDTYAGEVQVLRGINFYLNKGESLAIVGESGSGKSVTVQSIMKLIPMPPGRFKQGSIVYKGEDIIPKSERQMMKLRGKEIGMIFQNPMGSLNPTMKVGKQIMEGILIHQKVSKKEAKAKALELVKLVGIPNPETRIKQYPHQFSGGMRQRVVIAIALACNPDILIADEPTTALDVTIQAQILDLMKDLKVKLNTSIILITHDLGVVADIAERVIVMYGGEIMEEGTAKEVFFEAQHPYTWGLIDSMPRIEDDSDYPLISIDGTPPDLLSPPIGCPFAARCIYAMRICSKKKPPNYEYKNGHFTKCWLKHEDAPKIQRKSPHAKIEAGI
ncbi:MAG: ABC transporter ATP-binding protein [bacterium]|nr:ABC transporter ATP-binding protein [bacterium]